MLRTLTWTQFREWQQYDALEPFGETRADYRAASIVQAIVNMNRDSKRHPQPFKITDFVLAFGEQDAPKPKGWRELKQAVQMCAAAYAPEK